MANFNKLLFILLMGISFGAKAQDIHFSQFNQSPLAINPALTGNYACDWRAGVNYRSQWSSLAPYKTFSVFADAPIVKGIRGSDNLAAGIFLYNDVSGDGNLSSLSALVSVAYHLGFGGGTQSLSLGVQSGFMQKSLDWQKLYFANQFDGADFDPSIANFEPYGGENITNLDLNLGLVYKGKFGDKFSIELGGAGVHITSPSETFLTNAPANDLGMRITGHGKMVIGIGNNLAIIPSALYQSQSGASETVVGADIGYFIRNPKAPATVYLGGYMRMKDAIIASVGVDYKNIRLGVSYDVNNSTLEPATNGNGGLEISLVYTGCILPVIPENYVLPCPRY